MKYLIKITLLLALFVVGQSCSDILNNAQPSQSISQEVTLSNPGAVEAIRAGMYNRLHRPTYTTRYMLGPDVLADNLSSAVGTNRYSGMAQNSNTSGMMDGGGSGTFRTGYAVSYDLINDANLLITGIEDEVLDQGTLQQYRGEAYFMRAFAYHHLVRSLGYEPGQTPSSGPGAGFNLGVILRTQATTAQAQASFKPRSTVAEVYTQIRNDLDQAINLLSQSGTGSPIYATEAAAEALYARVELYAQNYSEAETHASNALSATSASLAQPGDVPTMFDETSGQNPEGIFITNFNVPTEGTDQPTNDALNAYTAQQWLAQVPTQDVMNLYSSGDARLAWFAECFDEVTGSSQASTCLGTHPNVAGGGTGLEVQKWNAERGNFTDNVPLFRVAEMKLIQAEARINGASGVAVTPYNDLRQARGLGTAVAVNMQDVRDERRREFIAEGQRFYDLKRLGMDIRKAPGTAATTVPYDDHRVLDNLPFNEVTLSQEEAPADSALVQNPGYN